MDDEYGLIFVEHENDLEKSAAGRLSRDPPFPFTPIFGVRRLRIPDDDFGFFRRNAVLGDVLDIPLIPSELHASVIFYK